MKVSWPGDGGEIHTRILERMREVLFGEEEYPYLMPNAKKRLMTARAVAKATEMKNSMLVSLGGSSWVLFPWLGTLPFRTLKRYLKHHAKRFGISDIQSEGCLYITFKGKGDLRATLLNEIREDLNEHAPDLLELLSESESPIRDKYDDYIPAELLRKEYVADRLGLDEFLTRFGGNP